MQALNSKFAPEGDGAMLTNAVFKQAGTDHFAYLTESSHFKRLSNLGIERDVRFCLEPDHYHVVPVMRQGRLVV
jgi:2-phosphosulfolactate phosphatase